MAGAFAESAAIVFGEFTAVTAREKDGIAHALRDFAARMSVPVVSGLPVGHDRRNAPLPFGSATGFQARLAASPKGGAVLELRRIS